MRLHDDPIAFQGRSPPDPYGSGHRRDLNHLNVKPCIVPVTARST
jgi:hypothetical protein